MSKEPNLLRTAELCRQLPEAIADRRRCDIPATRHASNEGGVRLVDPLLHVGRGVLAQRLGRRRFQLVFAGLDDGLFDPGPAANVSSSDSLIGGNSAAKGCNGNEKTSGFIDLFPPSK
jgi:hypothetical protein